MARDQVRNLLRGAFFPIKGSRELRLEDIPEIVALRFIDRLRREPSGCLTWTGSRNADGYGIVRIEPRRQGHEGRRVLAHRLVIAIEDGVCPAMRVGDHFKCGNRACCERAHLRMVTPMENTPGIYGLGRQEEVVDDVEVVW